MAFLETASNVTGTRGSPDPDGPVPAAGYRGPRRRGRWSPYLLLLPAAAWLVVFFVLPTLSLASQSLQEGDVDNGFVLTWRFQNYLDAVSVYWPQFVRSLGYAAVATLGALVLGYPWPGSSRTGPAGGRTSCSSSSSPRSSRTS